MKTETYTCQHCGKDVERPISRGTRPKWCSECRILSPWQIKAITCQGCGKASQGLGEKFCSVACSNQHRPERPKKIQPARIEPFDPRSAMRKAYDEGDVETFLTAVVCESDTSTDCWIWKRLKDGYPVWRVGRKNLGLHRVVLEMKFGATLGSQHAHHTCANSGCVNPDHLQPVTHRDNVAEMLARQSYLARIRELEAALASVAPDHQLLSAIATA